MKILKVFLIITTALFLNFYINSSNNANEKIQSCNFEFKKVFLGAMIGYELSKHNPLQTSFSGVVNGIYLTTKEENCENSVFLSNLNNYLNPQ